MVIALKGLLANEIVLLCLDLSASSVVCTENTVGI